MTIIAGIDPGKSGAVCQLEYIPPTAQFISWDMCPLIQVGKKSVPDLMQMRNILTTCDEVWIEKVHAMPKQGVTSMFTFGMGYGLWQGIAIGLNKQLNWVAPQTWQKFWLKDMPREKGSSIIRAQSLFPNIDWKMNKKNKEACAEALLIALYGVYHKNPEGQVVDFKLINAGKA